MINTELNLIRAWVQYTVAHTRTRTARDQRGEIAQTVIIVAVLAAAAITITAIIASKFIGKANSIPTE